MIDNILWRCPECGREFRHKGQSHSCVSYPPESHFQGKPAFLKQTFEYLIQKLREF